MNCVKRIIVTHWRLLTWTWPLPVAHPESLVFSLTLKHLYVLLNSPLYITLFNIKTTFQSSVTPSLAILANQHTTLLIISTIQRCDTDRHVSEIDHLSDGPAEFSRMEKNRRNRDRRFNRNRSHTKLETRGTVSAVSRLTTRDGTALGARENVKQLASSFHPHESHPAKQFASLEPRKPRHGLDILPTLVLTKSAPGRIVSDWPPLTFADRMGFLRPIMRACPLRPQVHGGIKCQLHQ